MFTEIQYDIHLAPNHQYPAGRRFKEHHQLQPGFGAITGPNESGKSMLLEVARFILFGAKALRGKASDYTSFQASANLVVRDMNLRIEKSLSNAKLFIDDELIVRGTAPVNARLREIFGFGLQIFDVANSINQGQIEALQEMGPAKRAKLIGGVIGLDKIDDLMKYAAEVALGHDRAAQAVEGALVAPTQPPEPEGYPNRTIMEDFLAQAEKDQRELDLVTGQLMAPAPAAPADPGPRPVELAEADLVEMITANARHRELTIELERLPTIDVPAAEAALDAYEAWMEAQAFLKQNPAPRITLEEAEAARSTWVARDEFYVYQEQVKTWERLKHQLEHLDQATCPQCDHTFVLDEARRAEVQAELDALGGCPAAPGSGEMPAAPTINREQARHRIEKNAEYQELIDKRSAAEAVPEAPAPQYSRFDLSNYNPTRKAEIDAELATLGVMWQAEEMLGMLRAWQASSDTYAERLTLYEEATAERARLQERKEYCSYAPARLAELRPIVGAYAPYEQAMKRYEHDRTSYEQRRASVAEMRAAAERWRAGREALAVLRTKIKQHLYPSLAKAASVLIAGMTNGARRTIEIDDDFEVLVDGQRLETLSGSGKAVANLSIRLGLGQVLTHKALPIVFADEIDASMDDTRAAATQDIVRKCAQRVSQLLLVSHKKPEADWYIELGAKSE